MQLEHFVLLLLKIWYRLPWSMGSFKKIRLMKTSHQANLLSSCCLFVDSNCAQKWSSKFSNYKSCRGCFTVLNPRVSRQNVWSWIERKRLLMVTSQAQIWKRNKIVWFLFCKYFFNRKNVLKVFMWRKYLFCEFSWNGILRTGHLKCVQHTCSVGTLFILTLSH